jgi:hypothetical protein
MKKIVIISITIVIIIAAGIILLNSNEQSVEEKWISEEVTSGPFTLDKNQYNLGEKIFITVKELQPEDKGQMIFFRPLNSTSWSNYKTLDFNGNSKENFNLYFQPQLSEMKKLCSTNELVGTWIVKFIGTDYSDINFKIINQTSSWDERTFDPVC